jgi:hypothetical protein
MEVGGRVALLHHCQNGRKSRLHAEIYQIQPQSELIRNHRINQDTLLAMVEQRKRIRAVLPLDTSKKDTYSDSIHT